MVEMLPILFSWWGVRACSSYCLLFRYTKLAFLCQIFFNPFFLRAILVFSTREFGVGGLLYVMGLFAWKVV